MYGKIIAQQIVDVEKYDIKLKKLYIQFSLLLKIYEKVFTVKYHVKYLTIVFFFCFIKFLFDILVHIVN